MWIFIQTVAFTNVSSTDETNTKASTPLIVNRRKQPALLALLAPKRVQEVQEVQVVSYE